MRPSLTCNSRTSSSTPWLLSGADDGALFANHFHKDHRLAVFLGALFLIAPLLAVAGLWVAKQAGVAMGGKEASGFRHTLASLNPSGFFANNQTTETVTEGIQRGDPTSVEFESLFSKMLDEALTGSRRLLLVLDNLDRVSESDARTVLATMQTFTGSAHAAQPWAPRLWTLLPYDPSGLARLWNPDAAREAAAATGDDAG